MSIKPFDYPIGKLLDTIKYQIGEICGYESSSPHGVNHHRVLIAGGYLRDHLLEREQDDVDVFIDVRRVSNYNGTFDELVNEILSYKTADGTVLFDQVVEDTYESDAAFLTMSPTAIYGSWSVTFGNVTVQVPAAVQSYAPTHSSSKKIKEVPITNSGIAAVVNKDVAYKVSEEMVLVRKVQFIFIHTDPLSYVKENFSCSLSKLYFDGFKITMLSDYVNAVTSKTNILIQRTSSSESFNSFCEKIKRKYPDFTHIEVRNK